MKGSCNGCGDCCAVVTLGAGMMRSANAAIDRGDMGPDILWVRDDLRPLTWEEALRRRPSLGEVRDDTALYECRHFDYQTRRCTNYENRPPVCRNFPWYTHHPYADGLTGLPECGYWEDVPFFKADAAGLGVLA